MNERIEALEQAGLRAITAASTTDELEQVRVRFLGRRAELPNLLRGVAELPPEQRGAVGKAANQARRAIEAALEQRQQQLAASELDERLAHDRIDVTLPADPSPRLGSLHLITSTWREIEDVFLGLGYTIAEGPEVERVYYNFDALNFDATHPSRLMTDTFYIEPTHDIFDPRSLLLRVHTSPIQVRAMEQQPPPIHIIVPGRVYRPDSDATHTPQFHQVEGLAVDEGITLGDLRGTLLTFARAIFGEEREVRLRPHFFPFTEPSVEVDVSCFNCTWRHHAERRALPPLQGHGLDRDPRRRDGRPERLRVRARARLRPRPRAGLRVRDGDRADRDAQARRHRHPPAV